MLHTYPDGSVTVSNKNFNLDFVGKQILRKVQPKKTVLFLIFKRAILVASGIENTRSHDVFFLMSFDFSRMGENLCFQGFPVNYEKSKATEGVEYDSAKQMISRYVHKKLLENIDLQTGCRKWSVLRMDFFQLSTKFGNSFLSPFG